MACTLYWPLARLSVSGEGGECCNSLSGFICRQIGEYKRRLNLQTDGDVGLIIKDIYAVAAGSFTGSSH